MKNIIILLLSIFSINLCTYVVKVNVSTIIIETKIRIQHYWHIWKFLFFSFFLKKIKNVYRKNLRTTYVRTYENTDDKCRRWFLNLSLNSVQSVQIGRDSWFISLFSVLHSQNHVPYCTSACTSTVPVRIYSSYFQSSK